MNKKDSDSKQVIGKKLIELDSVDSTNNYLSKLIKETNVLNGTVILAHYQTHGKGQRGNAWESNKGDNLTFSFCLDTSFLKISQNFLLSMMVCNSVHELIIQYTDLCHIKWPNDILVHSKKACGILIENSIKNTHLNQSIIGIGINVFQQKFSMNSKATSLQKFVAEEIKKDELFEKLLTILNKNYLLLSQGNQLVIKNYYLKHLLGYQEELNYEWTSTNEYFIGEILEVLDNGLIKLRINRKGIKTIEMKEVRLA